MANNDSTSINTIIEIDAVSYDEAYLFLERAHGVLDVIFTLEASGNNSTTELYSGSLAAALDAAMVSIAQARELLSSGTMKQAVK